jgi:autotransporter-associated beta strand protein
MKNKFCFANLRVSRRLTVPVIISAVFACALMQAKLQAQTLWSGALTAGPHTWNTTLNWTGANIPNTDTEIGDLRRDWTAAPTVNFTDNTTINGIFFDDTGGGTDVAMILASSPTTAAVTLAGTTPTIQVTGTMSINSPVAGTTPWRKTGGGRLVLNGTNTFNTGVTVADGFLRLGTVAASAGAGGNFTVTNGENPAAANTNGLELVGGLTFGAGRTVTLNNTSTSNIVFARTALINESGNNTWAGSIVLLGGTNQTIQSTAGTFTISGNITNGVSAPTSMFIRGVSGGTVSGNINIGNTSFFKTDGGTWTISSTGNVHGNVGVASGGITVNNTNALHPPSVVTFGEGNTNTGTLTINSGRVQALGGLLLAPSTTTGSGHRVIGAGTLEFGWPSKTVNVVNAPAANDLTISTAISGLGGFTKTGPGRLVVNGASVQGPANVTTGSLAAQGAFNGGITMGGGTSLIVANLGTVATLTTPTLAFGSGLTTLDIDAGGGVADLIQVTASGGLTQAGTTTINIGTAGGFDVGVYPLISYTGASPGISGFVLGTKPDSILAATLIDTGSAIALDVTAVEKLLWTGAADSNWDLATLNWDTIGGPSGVAFTSKDDVVFGDGPTNTTIALVGTIDPQRVEFTADSTAYTLASGTLSGAVGMELVKSGDGTVVLQNANTYNGLTDIQAGTLELDHDGGTLTATSGVVVGPTATFRVTDDDGDFTVNRVLSGSGSVQVNPNTAASTAARTVTFSAASPGFSGNLILETPAASGSARLAASAAAVGGSTVTVQGENQLFCSNGNTYANNITITGDGFNDAGSSIGALRLEGATWNGSVTITGTPGDSGGTAYEARIGSAANNSTINGAISGGDLSFWSWANASCAFFLTAPNTFGDLIIGGSPGTGAGGGQAFVTIGANQAVPTNTTATLGSGDVYLVSGTNVTDPQNSIIRFNRADGYTLAAGQDIIGSGANALEWGGVQVLADSLGTGFSTGANTINLANLGLTQGGQIRVGTVTNGATFNIDPGATIRAGDIRLGEAANLSTTATQAAGSTVSLTNQLRVGHFATETSVYNMTGGSLTITGPSPLANPSSADVANEQNGGIYVGIDGQGIINHTGGAVTTNWVVLDNRGNNGAGANMLTGIDQYNLTTGTLALKSTWGIIQRNPSSEFNLGGGTISIDNTGTGTGTGSALTIPLNTLVNVSGTASVLDTVLADNSFSLNGNVLGGGTLNLAGSGVIRFNPTAPQTISAVLAGTTNPVAKIGASSTTLTGVNTYSTATTVEAGTLNVAGSLNDSDVSVFDAATIGGEGSVKSLVLGTTTGSNLLIDGSTAGALTVNGALVHNGTTTVDFAGTPTGNTVTVLNYNGGVTGAGTFALANAANYRSSSFSDSGSVVTLTLDLKDLTWTGADGVSPTVWDVNGVENWTDGAAQKFFNGDSVTFNDTPGVSQTVAITGNVLPEAVTFNHSTIDYTLNGATGNGIGGTASLTKSGTGTLNIAAANTFSGPVSVTGGVLKLITGGNSGLGASGNTVTVTSPGQVNYNGIAPAGGTGYSFSIAGNGPDSRGAIVNEVVSLADTARILNLTLTDNASVGTYGGTLPVGNRLDIGFNGTNFGAIDGGGFTLTKVGDAMVNVRGAATNISYVVNAGTLRAENSGLALGATGVTVNGGTLDSFGTLSFGVPVTLATGTALTSSSGTGTWTGGLSITGDVNFGGAGTIDVASAITGGGSLVKVDAGTLILSAANTLGSTTTITAGNLQANHASALGGSTVNITNPAVGGRLIVNGGVTLPNNVTVGSAPTMFGLVGRGFIESTGTGQGVYSGTITINSAPSSGGTFLASNTIGNELMFIGPVNTTGGVQFTQRDGRVIFAGGGTATGSTFINTGTTILGADEGFPSGVTLSVGGSGAATFEMAGFSQTLAGLIRATGNAATVTNTALTLSTLNLNIAGSSSYTGLITGNLELVKLGAGTKEFPFPNTYTGATTVSAGTLRVSNFIGSATGTGTVTVGAGGTLAGTGIVGGDVVVNGLVTPGVTSGTLTVNSNVAFNAGSILRVDVSDASVPKQDLLSVAGSLSATDATIDFDVTGTLVAPAYVIATYTGSAPTGFTAVDVPAGYVVDYDYNGNSVALVNAYLGWAADNGLTAGVNDGKLQDPDNDGIANVVEFATDGNPLSGEDSGKIRSIIADVDSGAPVDNALTITLPVRAGAVFNGPGDLVSDPVDGIVYKIQSSTNLSDFTTPNVTEVTDNAAILTQLSLPALSSPAWTYRTFRAPGTPGTDVREFLRIVAD